MLAQERKSASQADMISIELISGLFLILGLAAFAILFVGINRDPLIIEATQSGAGLGATVLAFLDSFGIVLPLLLIGLGAFAVRLGLRLRQRDLISAGWAHQSLLWLLILSIILVVQAISAASAPDSTSGLGGVLPWLILVIAAAIGYWWLGNNMTLFEGKETLTDRSSRTAWNLLVPTIVVLLVVAARPLEETFIASLTDQRFASSEKPVFVGLDNYARLLGVRLDVIPCETAEDGSCLVENGETVYPRARDYLSGDYRDLRFRDVSTFDILGTHFVFSARDDDFIHSIGNTLTFTFFSVVLELVLGIFIAMVVNSKFSGRGLLRTAMLVPWAIPTVVSARLWEIMLRDNQSGVINHFLVNIGVMRESQAWLANPNLQLPAIIAVDVWKTTPFMALILLAGLQVISSDIYEAADVDGASKVRQFFQLTLPLLRPTIAVALVFRTLDAVRVFDVFNVLLGRQKLSMATYNYETLVQSQELGYASAVGVVIFVIILVFTVVYVKWLGVSAE